MTECSICGIRIYPVNNDAHRRGWLVADHLALCPGCAAYGLALGLARALDARLQWGGGWRVNGEWCFGLDEAVRELER